ncbi:hypothetical protein GCM10008090_05610 [Arenicella chitinivorans]|uniref:Uncharacterized protein n=1 Tax=Arenicella chitinivorans TaxID=1329800 RepID=A0A918RKD9_9GAMM|nr:hypothetical protein [Arenicella chitinivorans]GGZ99835.1 hypothetical protein GCM10008090_05610 [Arenicella chitinivorans]
MLNLMNVTSTQNEACEYGAPTAIVLADKLPGQEIVEVFGEIEAASLVVAGKSVVEHVLQELQELKFQQCIVLAGNNAEQVLKRVGNDGRWGMTVNVMQYACSTEQVLREFKSVGGEHGLLVIEADKLRGFCVAEFLRLAHMNEHTLLQAQSAGHRPGLTLLKPSKADFVINSMPIELPGVKVNLLHTARDFHQANFDLMAGKFHGLEPSVLVNRQVGRRQHWSSHVSRGVAGNWSDVMIEKHCQVGREVRLNSVILNRDVYVEDHACLDHTIVMPNSMVSAEQVLTDSIIHAGTVFQLS